MFRQKRDRVPAGNGETLNEDADVVSRYGLSGVLLYLSIFYVSKARLSYYWE
jgi:hypothetical protein